MSSRLLRLASILIACGALAGVALWAAVVATADEGPSDPGPALRASDEDDRDDRRGRDDGDDRDDRDDENDGDDEDDAGAPAPAAPPPTVAGPAPSAAVVPAAPPSTPAPADPGPIAANQLVRPHAMRPALGRTITTRRPTLRWRHLGRGVHVYNVQIFHRRKKVISAFVTTGRYRVPPGRLAPGRRYVWRVWPHMTRGGYTDRPLGVSWFATPPAAPAIP